MSTTIEAAADGGPKLKGYTELPASDWRPPETTEDWNDDSRWFPSLLYYIYIVYNWRYIVTGNCIDGLQTHLPIVK